jgi:hypothetical protein
MHGKAPRRRATRHANAADVPGTDRASAQTPDPPILVITPETEKLVGESRWNRNRKRVGKPYREREYPSDPKMQRLACLAKLGTAEPGNQFDLSWLDGLWGFDSHIRSIILDAHLLDRSYRGLSAPRVRGELESVKKKADALKEALKNIDLGCGSSAEKAGQILEIALSNFKFREGAVLIPEYVALLTELCKAASQATQLAKSKRGPKGAAGTSLAFDRFIQQLLMAAWQRRGDWTISHARDGHWSGSLLEALKILRPYLPPGLLPVGDLGRAAEHVRTKFKGHIENAHRQEIAATGSPTPPR